MTDPNSGLTALLEVSIPLGFTSRETSVSLRHRKLEAVWVPCSGNFLTLILLSSPRVLCSTTNAFISVTV